VAGSWTYDELVGSGTTDLVSLFSNTGCDGMEFP
jgi:hypothetical protein